MCHLAQSEVSQVPSGSICGESSAIWFQASNLGSLRARPVGLDF